MKALLPEYTGVESIELAGNGPHSVLVGSKLQLGIKTNKPLSQSSLKIGDEVFAMQQASDDQTFELTVPGPEGQLAGGEYEFELTDVAGLKSSRRSKFKIAIKEDEPPRVRAKLWGISGLVSSRAMLPTSYSALDEYGLRSTAFDCSWKAGDDASGERELPIGEFSAQEDGTPTRKAEKDAVLDLVPLKLSPGTSFRFAVAAYDNYPGQAKIGKSQEFLLRVVSDDELRADLLRREIEQRKAFDQAYQIQLELTTEIQAIAAKTPSDGTTQENFEAQRESSLIELVRNQKGVGTAIDRVASRFEDFLVEVKNNRLDEAENAVAPDQRIETRFDQKIIQPIRRLDSELVSMATRHLDDCRRAVQVEGEFENAVGQTVAVQTAILDEMKRILSAMNDSESFQEIINGFLELKDQEVLLKKIIEDTQKPADDVFENEDDIFETEKKP